MTAASAPTGGAIIWAASIRIWSSDEAAVALGNEGWQAVSRQRAGADTLDFPRGATNKHTIPSRVPNMLDHAGPTILEKSIKSPPQSRPGGCHPHSWGIQWVTRAKISSWWIPPSRPWWPPHCRWYQWRCRWYQWRCWCRCSQGCRHCRVCSWRWPGPPSIVRRALGRCRPVLSEACQKYPEIYQQVRGIKKKLVEIFL